MYEYNIMPNVSTDRFQSICEEVRTLFPQAKQEKLLQDVDGSLIQVFVQHGGRIAVHNDMEIGALYVKSDMPLSLNGNAESERDLTCKAAQA